MFEAKAPQKLFCTPPWLDGEGPVDLNIDGQTVVVSRSSKVICESTAPFQTYAHHGGLLPTFDTHSSYLASDSLAELLPQCEIILLVVKDEAARCWGKSLSECLRRLGATNVPPAYRASWAFLWTPQHHLESYKTDGVASLEADICGHRYKLESAGFRSGNYAQITVDGMKLLPEPEEFVRGVHCYAWGLRQTPLFDKRCFESEGLCNTNLYQLQEGARCVVVCNGEKKPRDSRDLHLTNYFHESLMRLGCSGLAVGASDKFVLSGTILNSCPERRDKPEPGEIAAALLQRPKLSTGYAFTSLLFGERPAMCLGALVLAKSLQRHVIDIPRILLVSQDVPGHFRKVLHEGGWQIREVEYLYGAYTQFNRQVKFPSEIFMKLHMFNPAVLPFEKVLFLDLDTFIRKDVTSVFQMDAPAAVNNWKDTDGCLCLPEGDVMNVEKTSLNAGVFLSSPNAALFELLQEDARRPGKHHVAAWTPEQSYLSTILTGHLRHLHCKYNFESQIHGGTCTSQDWMACEIDDVHIVHFSGTKPWELSTHDEITCIAWQAYESNRKKYRMLESHYFRKLASRRCRVFHEEWYAAFGEIAFLQDASLDEDGQAHLQGVVAAHRIAVFLQRMSNTSHS